MGAYNEPSAAPKKVVAALAVTLAVFALVAIVSDNHEETVQVDTTTLAAAPCPDGMGGCAPTSMLTQCVQRAGAREEENISCTAAIALSAENKGVSETCNHMKQILKTVT